MAKRKSPLDVLRSNTTGANEDEAEELFLYADNTSELYPRKKAILANLLRKVLKGTYNSESRSQNVRILDERCREALLARVSRRIIQRSNASSCGEEDVKARRVSTATW